MKTSEQIYLFFSCPMAEDSNAMIATPWDLLGIVVQPLDLHVVNVGSIPTGPTHGEGRLPPHPGDVHKSTPNVRKSPRSGLSLEGRLSDPNIFGGPLSPENVFLEFSGNS